MRQGLNWAGQDPRRSEQNNSMEERMSRTLGLCGVWPNESASCINVFFRRLDIDKEKFLGHQGGYGIWVLSPASKPAKELKETTGPTTTIQ